ncbi:hypothetical protein DV26_06550 [Amycolatopsis mediterranei]|nr:hypothetical protein DV26_06550 [Amycolatopsis mediterranei]KDU90966.1 hypothetical protein DV36_16945 [Amycolatopsis mediterranei]
MSSLVIECSCAVRFRVAGLPSMAATACWTPWVPIEAGSWAIRAWYWPFLRPSTSDGLASKPIRLTAPTLPALRRPVAAPSPVFRLVAKTPMRSGVDESAAVTLAAACSGSFWVNWTPIDFRFGVFLSSSSKPLARAAVVDVPAIVSSTRTEPLLPAASFAIVCAASLPPAALSEETDDTATPVSFSAVSTSTIFVPRALTCWIGASIAVSSVGAISSAAGGFAPRALTSWVCRGASNFCGACVVSS